MVNLFFPEPSDDDTQPLAELPLALKEADLEVHIAAPFLNFGHDAPSPLNPPILAPEPPGEESPSYIWRPGESISEAAEAERRARAEQNHSPLPEFGVGVGGGVSLPAEDDTEPLCPPALDPQRFKRLSTPSLREIACDLNYLIEDAHAFSTVLFPWLPQAESDLVDIRIELVSRRSDK